MIHVAPCSCELHVRIRELEAELEKRGIEMWRSLPGFVDVLEDNGKLKARAEKAEARVAELMRALDEHGCVLPVGGQHTLAGGIVLKTALNNAAAITNFTAVETEPAPTKIRRSFTSGFPSRNETEGEK